MAALSRLQGYRFTKNDDGPSRFTVLRNEHEEEAELWRGKLQAFHNLYGFLSQVIPSQDSDLKRL